MKVITPKIQKELSKSLIELIWTFYDECYQDISLDDYQFITIYTDSGQTYMKMFQEYPPAFKIKPLLQNADDNEIWIVKDGDVQTMLFPSEY